MIRGFVLGKFMPPHLGHLHLCEFASERCDELTVLVCSLPTEPIGGELRFRWMSELRPHDRVRHLRRVVPQEPAEHPGFWDIWRTIVLEQMPYGVDRVFASEDYGARLADEVGAEFVMCDRQRQRFAVSGTAVRRDPVGHLDLLPAPVREHWLSRQRW